MSQTPLTSEEILQVFDASGNPTHGLPRSVVKTKPYQHWCGVVTIWLINSRGELICSKRSELLKGNPGKWQTCFGGHLKCDQSFEGAVQAELEEEAGLIIDPSKLSFVLEMSDANHWYHAKSYIYPFEGELSDLKFNDGEITEVRAFSLDEYTQESEKYPEHWCHSLNSQGEAEPIIRAWIENNIGR